MTFDTSTTSATSTTPFSFRDASANDYQEDKLSTSRYLGLLRLRSVQVARHKSAQVRSVLSFDFPERECIS
ncbi:MAG: hypothetical protein V7L20_20195 [Nostoc sp.]